MNTYKIVSDDGTTRFAQKDEVNPLEFGFGYHSLVLSEDRYDFQVIDGGFIAKPKSGESTQYTVTQISLEDTALVLPNTHRTFDTDEDLDLFVTKKFMDDGLYAPLMASSSDLVSVVLSPESFPAALIKEEGGDTFIREDSDWVEILGEEYPEIYGTLVRVDKDDIPSAIPAWDLAQMSGDSLDIIFKYVEA